MPRLLVMLSSFLNNSIKSISASSFFSSVAAFFALPVSCCEPAASAFPSALGCAVFAPAGVASAAAPGSADARSRVRRRESARANRSGGGRILFTRRGCNKRCTIVESQNWTPTLSLRSDVLPAQFGGQILGNQVFVEWTELFHVR